MLAGLSNRLPKNGYGHSALAWRMYVKNSERRRDAYADWLQRVRPGFDHREAAGADLPAEPLFQIPDADGALAVPAGVIPGTEAAVEAIDRLKLKTVRHKKRPFLKTLYLGADDLATEPALLNYALNPGLVASVARYLGCMPVLYYVYVWISEHVDDANAKSQLLHCDADDRRIASLFLYASDVDAKSGPVTAIRASVSQEIRDGIGYKYGGGGYRVPDDKAAPYLKPDSELKLVGPRGTLAAVDTARCFHQGSRVEKDGTPRVTAIFRYLTPNAYVWPAYGGYQVGAAYRSLAGPASTPAERMVLGAL